MSNAEGTWFGILALAKAIIGPRRLLAACGILCACSLCDVGFADARLTDGSSDFPVSDVETGIRLYFDDARHATGSEFRRYSPLDLVRVYGAELVPGLEARLRKKESALEAYLVLFQLAEGGKDRRARTDAVSCVVRLVHQDRHSLPGIELLSAYYDCFETASFSRRSRELLHQMAEEMVAGEAPAKGANMLLMGTSGDRALVPLLRQLDGQIRRNPDPEFPLQGREALRACARIGDNEALRTCIQLVDSLEQPLLKARQLQALSYIRQPEVVEYIKRFLFSDEKEPDCGIDCYGVYFRERASDALALMLSGFPEYEDIDVQREWMSRQKEWKIRR